MKTTKIKRYLMTIVVSFLFSSFTFLNLQAQEDCEVAKENGYGYTTTIKEVTDLGGDSYYITLSVFFDGCPGPGCKNVSYIAFEASPGTYSNVSATAIVSGNTYTPSVNLGPGLGGVPFQGMKISGLGDFGNNNNSELVLTYTLTGGFQNQQILVKASSKTATASLQIADFQSVLECGSPNIFPYYPPPEGGKAIDCLILGPELCSFYGTYINLGQVVTDDVFQTDGVTVLIVVEAVDNQLATLETTLAASNYGMTDIVVSASENTITGLFPIDNLLFINDLDGVAVEARPVYPPLFGAGLVTSQGDAAMRADISRNVFGLGGAGVKIGVLSDSYNTQPGDPANDDVVKGDLPGIGIDAGGNSVPNPLNDTDVDVLLDYPLTASDEGRAMLQIIHDVAPQADLAFRTAFLSDVDFAQGIIDLANAGCDIIVDDVTYIEEPFFRDGIIAQAVETVTAAGVSYFSAAGNYGTSGYLSDFNPVSAPSGLSGQAHNFAGTSGTDVYQNVTVPEGSYTIVLQWDDGQPYGDAIADIDIYLAREDGSPLFGFNRDNTAGRQLEVLPFTVGPGGAETNLIIVNANNYPGVTFQYVVFRGQLTQNEWANEVAPTLVGQANSESAIAVGAVLYINTPEYGVDPPTPASFSSRGGTPVNGTVRNKPNVMGPNGVNTTVDLGGFELEGDAFPNFFGTSAAAPHVAAVGALLKEATSKYYGTDLSPSALKSILETTALDMETSGYDVATGYGYTQADAALVTLANPTPLVTDLVYDTILIPGVDTIVLTVIGEYLTDGSTIYFNGEPIDGPVTMSGDTSITTTLLPFGPLLYQPIQVNNEPLEGTNGTDGGLSDPIYFTDKETILITLADKSKTYGEVNPEFTPTSIELVNLDGNSVPIETSDLSTAEIARIQSIVFEAPNVSSLTNSGLWAIKADASDPLNPASGVAAADPLDISLLEEYNFAFFDGILTIDPLDMTIIPQGQVITYGEEPGDFEFDYIFNGDNSLNITPEDIMALTNAASTAHATVLVNARSTALGFATATALVNYSFLVSATPLVNSTGLFDLEFEDPNVLFDATALVNGTAKATVLVNGTAKATVLVNATALVNGTATVLVNGTATPLVNATALVNANATALVNATTINANSNSQTIMILGEEDIDVLLGNAQGEIVLKAMNLFPSTDVGSHWVLPGAATIPNLNISYEPGGPLTVLPAVATVTFDPTSLYQTYDGLPKSILATSGPEILDIVVTYNGLSEPPVEAGMYEVIATVNDPNYIGSATTTMTIDPAQMTVTADDLGKTYGEDDPEFTFIITEGGLFGEDAFTGELVREIGENAASYIVSQGTLTAGDNYTVSFVNGTFTIDQALLSVTPEILSKTYGEADPELTYQITSGVLVGEDGFSGMLVREEGEDVNTYAVSQGTLTAGNNYDLMVEPGTFAINQTFLSVTPGNLSKTYGEADPEFTFQITAGVLVDGDGFSGVLVREEGEDVNTYAILQGSLTAGDNYDLTVEPGTFTINPVLITVTADNLNKTYGESDPVLTYQLTSGALVGTDEFSGDLEREVGEYVNTYIISQGNLTGGGNYTLSFVGGIFTINPALITVTADNLNKTYGESDPELTYQLTSGNLVGGDTFTGELVREAGENAGSYNIQQGDLSAGTNYTLTFVTGTFTIDQVVLTITAGIDFIFEGDPLPTYNYSFDGFVNGDNQSVLSNLTYSLSPNYNGQAGTYTVIPEATSVNYSISTINGTLYVNPFGPGTKHIIPKVICVDPMPAGSPYGYIATFEYKNNNNANVYIPYGEDNFFQGAGSYDASEQPQLFLQGTNTFEVPFDGTELTWTVASYNHKGQKAAQGSSASSSSPSCSKAAEVDEGLALTFYTDELKAYPNPATDRVNIILTEALAGVKLEDISVYDLYGKVCPVKGITAADGVVEIDLSGLQSGLYFVNFVTKDTKEILRIIKQ